MIRKGGVICVDLVRQFIFAATSWVQDQWHGLVRQVYEGNPAHSKTTERCRTWYNLNFVKQYAAFLFRSLARPSLQHTLPRSVEVVPYRWVGLNVQDPLWQFRLKGHFVQKFRRKKLFYHSEPHSLLYAVFRYVKASNRHEAQVPLMCSKCSGSSYVIDQRPRYEISTGVYLTQLRMRCHSCSPKRAVHLIPVDNTMSFKTFQSIVQALHYANAPQIAKDVEFASRAKLVATKTNVHRAWIRSQGVECRHDSRHADFVERADSIRRWLENLFCAVLQRQDQAAHRNAF